MVVYVNQHFLSIAISIEKEQPRQIEKSPSELKARNIKDGDAGPL